MRPENRIDDSDRAPPGPLLVTGAHRSGTTWVGRVLEAAPGMVYISEPFNPQHRPGVFRAMLHHWYTYIDARNETEFLSPVKDLIGLRYHAGAELRTLRTPTDIGRALRDSLTFLKRRLRRGSRPLLKDPFALLAGPWLADRFQTQSVVVVRHPAAFASSLKRLGWKMSLANFTGQPLLMTGPLRGMADEILRHESQLHSELERNAFIWKVLHFALLQTRDQWDNLIVVRHEDLSENPIEALGDLCCQLGLPATPRLQARIRELSSEANPAQARGQQAFDVKLDSRANLRSWRGRLTPAEVEKVRSVVEPVSQSFYDEGSWE